MVVVKEYRGDIWGEKKKKKKKKNEVPNQP